MHMYKWEPHGTPMNSQSNSVLGPFQPSGSGVTTAPSWKLWRRRRWSTPMNWTSTGPTWWTPWLDGWKSTAGWIIIWCWLDLFLGGLGYKMGELCTIAWFHPMFCISDWWCVQFLTFCLAGMSDLSLQLLTADLNSWGKKFLSWLGRLQPSTSGIKLFLETISETKLFRYFWMLRPRSIFARALVPVVPARKPWDACHQAHAKHLAAKLPKLPQLSAAK